MFEKNRIRLLCGVAFVFCLFLCTHPKNKSKTIDPLDKIHFDLSQLNEDGLHGPPDGLRSLSYEFCIPAEESFVAEVQSIDSTLVIHKDSPGRIGCSDDEYLCVGSTHQKNYREVLLKLASLEYIQKIEQSFFEQ